MTVMNLASILTRTAGQDGDRPAVRLGEAAMPYRELDEASARVAGLLRERGLEPGDRVGVMLPNTPEFAVTYYGVLRTGGVVVPMNPLLKAREVAYYLGDSGARLLFAWHGSRTRHRPARSGPRRSSSTPQPSARRSRPRSRPGR